MSTSSTKSHTLRQNGIRLFQEKLDSGEYAAQNVEQCYCGASNFKVLDAKERNGLDFASLLCMRCGLVHTSPRLDESALPRFYAAEYYPITYGTATAMHSESLSTTNFTQYQGYEIYERCVRWLLPGHQIRVMEIGCGCGLNLYQFARAARRDNLESLTIGVDYSPDHRRMALQVHGVGEVFASIDEFPRGNIVDVLVLSHVLEHFSDLDMWLRKLTRYVSENGIMYVEVPGLESLPENPGYMFSLRQYFHFAHIYCFNLRSLRSLFSRYGFELLSGDESIHAVFRRSKTITADDPDPQAAQAILLCAETLADGPYPDMGLALAAGREGRVDDGLRLARGVVSAVPDSPWAHAVLADLLARKGDARQAIAEADRAIELGHLSPLDMQTLRICQFARMGDRKEALLACDAFDKAAPHWNRTGRIWRAKIERMRGNGLRALQLIESIDDRCITEPEAVYQEALVLEALGRFSEAGDILSRLEQSFPGNLELKSARLLVLLKTNKIEEALQRTSEIIMAAVYRDKWVLTKCSLFLRRRGLYDVSLQCLDAALRLDPRFVDAQRLKGSLLECMRRYDEAVEAFRSVMREAPDDLEMLFRISGVYNRCKRFAESMAALDELEALAPNHPGISAARADVRALLSIK